MKHERQILLDGWNQGAVARTRVLVAGCGALGSQLALGLARLGVGHVTLMDADVLEEHNLENQAFDESDLGKQKVVALRERMKRIDPRIDVRTFAGLVQDFAGNYDFDVMFGAFDNVAARYYLSCTSVFSNVPLIDGGISRTLCTVTTILPGKSACYSCWPLLPRASRHASCSSDPIPSTYYVANATASLQLAQFARFVHSKPVPSHLMLDLERFALYANHLPRNPSCEICGDSP